MRQKLKFCLEADFRNYIADFSNLVRIFFPQKYSGFRKFNLCLTIFITVLSTPFSFKCKHLITHCYLPQNYLMLSKVELILNRHFIVSFISCIPFFKIFCFIISIKVNHLKKVSNCFLLIFYEPEVLFVCEFTYSYSTNLSVYRFLPK